MPLSFKQARALALFYFLLAALLPSVFPASLTRQPPSCLTPAARALLCLRAASSPSRLLHTYTHSVVVLLHYSLPQPPLLSPPPPSHVLLCFFLQSCSFGAALSQYRCCVLPFWNIHFAEGKGAVGLGSGVGEGDGWGRRADAGW